MAIATHPTPTPMRRNHPSLLQVTEIVQPPYVNGAVGKVKLSIPVWTPKTFAFSSSSPGAAPTIAAGMMILLNLLLSWVHASSPSSLTPFHQVMLSVTVVDNPTWFRKTEFGMTRMLMMSEPSPVSVMGGA